ncbi:MAG: hypothetical protein WCJ58_06105 [bacterium]
MKIISKETQSILDLIGKYGPIRPSQLTLLAKISNKNLHKHLIYLNEGNYISKIGSQPKTFYIKNEKNIFDALTFDAQDEFIEQNYLTVSPEGRQIYGKEGFQYWCKKVKVDYQKEKVRYVKQLKIFAKFKKEQLISAKKRILSGKGASYLDDLYFSDFYNLDYYGKTKLGQLVYFAKTSQNRELVGIIVKMIKPGLLNLIKKQNIQFIAYVPPTIARKVQFMDLLKNNLNLDLSEITVQKVRTATMIPQKTIRKLEDRITNAQVSIAIDPNQKINGNILIVDDATGSGATLNETARKIRNIASSDIKIFGYSVVGSYKGFEVISEV